MVALETAVLQVGRYYPSLDHGRRVRVVGDALHGCE
jgi:hypothetical protein